MFGHFCIVCSTNNKRHKFSNRRRREYYRNSASFANIADSFSRETSLNSRSKYWVLSEFLSCSSAVPDKLLRKDLFHKKNSLVKTLHVLSEY
jgi:hypothetical protein